ncbi:sulfatase family protein [Pontiella sulfatireligans]|uniref:Arylsulfatase n=1 Tax=Pontiella sulfatireligans TaxID=2750658 RepID=A0A6C2UDV3_9BACT|nr:arylsulfatase [Pontiella sulfatireligans]SPS74120.1 sulfatase S1_15 [Kiritimatiellales bacterium]VGO18023.1 Arylsulfatase [Pontiella sulfatireligans]
MKKQVIVGLLTLCCVSVFAEARSGQKPNIVIILADDMGYGEVQALNPDRCIVPTPNLDRLVHEGMTFTDGHSGASVCTPSRYALMTGRYSWRTLRTEGVGRGPTIYGNCMIAPGRQTIGGFMKEQGYRTSYIGKWHLGFSSGGPKAAPFDAKAAFGTDTHRPTLPGVGTRHKNTPFFHGFDYFYGYNTSGDLNTHVENDTIVKNCASSLVLKTLAEQAVKQVDSLSATDQPFLLYVAFNSPHLPVVPSAEWVGKSKLGIYGDFVMETDWAVGEVIRALKKNSILDDTMVLFSADNGFAPAGGNVNRDARADGKTFEELGHYPGGINRGHKAQLYEGGHRVPFILRWPQGGVKAGTTSDQIVCLTDLMATFADLLDADYPDNVGEDSLSMLPAIRGEKGLRDQVVHHSMKGNFAIRQGDWKLLFPGSGPKSDIIPPLELYNMKEDQSEATDLLGAKPEVVSGLIELIDGITKSGRSTPGEPQPLEREIDYRTTPKVSIVGEGRATR